MADAGDLDQVRRLLGAEHGLSVVSIVRPDGTVSASVVNAGLLPHPVDGATVLRDVFRAAGGTHSDWPEYDRVMADEQRTAVLVTPARVYGNASV